MRDSELIWETYQKSLMSEMPYITDINDNPTLSIDLEIEKYFNTPSGWQSFIENVFDPIMRGEIYKDKYGNKIKLSTPQEKESFITLVKDDNMINMFAKKFGASVEDLD